MKTSKKVISLTLCALVAISSLSFGASAKTKKFVKSIKVSKKATMTIPANKKTVAKTFKVKVKVSGKASKKFTAKTSNKSVATVKVSGTKIKVTAKKAGKATITLKTKAKGKKKKALTAKLVVTVKKASAPAKPATPTPTPTPTPSQDPTEATQPTTPTQDPTEATQSTTPTQEPTEATQPQAQSYKFYYSPSADELAEKDTFKLNYLDAEGKWTQVDMQLSGKKTADGAPVYEAEVPADVAKTIKTLQYQVYDETGTQWKGQFEFSDIENIDEIGGNIISSNGEILQPATEATEYQPTQTEAETITTPATEPTQAPTQPTTSDGWDPHIYQP